MAFGVISTSQDFEVFFNMQPTLKYKQRAKKFPRKTTAAERGWWHTNKTADTSHCKTPTETSKVQRQLPIFVLVESSCGLEKPEKHTAAGIYSKTFGSQVAHVVSVRNIRGPNQPAENQ